MALYRQRPDLFTHDVERAGGDEDETGSSKSFRLCRPFSAPPSPSASRSTSPNRTSGRSTPTSNLDEDEVDENTERLELGLQTVSINGNNEDTAAWEHYALFSPFSLSVSNSIPSSSSSSSSLIPFYPSAQPTTNPPVHLFPPHWFRISYIFETMAS